MALHHFLLPCPGELWLCRLASDISRGAFVRFNLQLVITAPFFACIKIIGQQRWTSFFKPFLRPLFWYTRNWSLLKKLIRTTLKNEKKMIRVHLHIEAPREQGMQLPWMAVPLWGSVLSLIYASITPKVQANTQMKEMSYWGSISITFRIAFQTCYWKRSLRPWVPSIYGQLCKWVAEWSVNECETK